MVSTNPSDPRGEPTIPAGVELVEGVGAIHLNSKWRQAFRSIRPGPRSREHPVEADVADLMLEHLMRVAMDDRDLVERLQNRLHFVGVFGPEVPVAIVFVER